MRVLAMLVLVAAGALLFRALRLHRKAESFRYGCTLESPPAWGEPVGHRFTREGQTLRRRALRLGMLAIAAALVGLLMMIQEAAVGGSR